MLFTYIENIRFYLNQPYQNMIIDEESQNGDLGIKEL